LEKQGGADKVIADGLQRTLDIAQDYLDNQKLV
jgi:hypothetical protein